MPKLNLAIQKSCGESWDRMAGTVSRRFCESCQKSVHDISQMTRREVAKLIDTSPNGLCGRVTRNQSGEVVFRREAGSKGPGRLVGISLLGASAVAAQTQSTAPSCKLEIKVADPSGAAIRDAQVSVARDKNWLDGEVVRTDSKGIADYELTAGNYNLRVASIGFASSEVTDIQCSPEKRVDLSVELKVSNIVMGEVVVIQQHAWYDPRPLFRRMLARL
jgi:hypothetical protein